MRFALICVVLRATVALASDTWVSLTPINAPMGSAVLAADALAPDTLYADAVAATGMGKSTDGGKTWTVLPFSARLLRKIVIEQNASNRVTAMGWDMLDFSVYRSADGGMTWTEHHVTPPIIGLPNDLAVDPLDSNTIYAAHSRSCFGNCIPNSGGVTKSSDGGGRWTALFNGVGIEQVLIDPFGSGTVYAVGALSRRSQNGGMTWTDLASPGGGAIFRMMLDPVTPGILYASTDGAFWRSDDRGDSWRQLGSPFFGPAWTITIDATRRGVIVVGGGTDSGAKRSTDGGETWQPLNDGLAVPQAPSQLDFIQVLFARNGTLYGAAGFQGAMMLKTPTGPRRRAAHH